LPWSLCAYAMTRLRYTTNSHKKGTTSIISTMGKTSKVARRSSESKEAVNNVVAKESSLVGRSDSPLSKDLVAEHLPPLGLVTIVMACTGILWVFAMRDVFATGRIIAGHHDAAMQVGSISCWFRPFLSCVAMKTLTFRYSWRLKLFLMLPSLHYSILPSRPCFSTMPKDGNRNREALARFSV
jgi:hypothetical protein